MSPPIGAEYWRSICGPGLRLLAAGDGVEHLLEGLRGQILVGVAADQHDRGVDAGAEALDLLPGEIAVGGDVELVVVDAPLADLFDLLPAAQQAGRGAAPLDVGLAADRLEQEHRVEGRDLEHADLRHAEHFGDVLDRLLRQPAAVLLLRPPQQRDHRGGLAALRILRDLALRPVEIRRREGEFLRLQFGRREAADGHASALRISTRGSNSLPLKGGGSGWGSRAASSVLPKPARSPSTRRRDFP